MARLATASPWGDVYSREQIDAMNNRVPLGPIAVTPTASPMTITAGDNPEVIYIVGGTITSVTKAGLPVAYGGGIRLAKGQAIVITYTVAPTAITRDRQ